VLVCPSELLIVCHKGGFLIVIGAAFSLLRHQHFELESARNSSPSSASAHTHGETTCVITYSWSECLDESEVMF